MGNNQCENTHPMLPINDNCVGNIKLLNVEDKDLIIQDLKKVIVEQKSKLVNYYNLSNKQNERAEKLINDLNICQSANKRQSEIIKELQLENSEVNKLLSTYKFSFYLIASIVTIVSVVCSIITLI